MYLAFMLIIVVLLVFYNEINNKMNLAEYILLGISLIAIIRASYNYIKIDVVKEGFSGNNNSLKKRKNANKDILVINSEEEEEYFEDSEEVNMPTKYTQSIEEADLSNKTSDEGINHINNLLGKSMFDDVTTTLPTDYNNNDNDITSVFKPQVIIGGAQSGSTSPTSSSSTHRTYGGFGSMGPYGGKWNSSFNNDNMDFNNTMNPVQNLWRNHHDYYDKEQCSTDNQWLQNMDSYNKGKWNPNFYKKPSDYVDYATTPTNEDGSTKKKCGDYNDIDTDQAGNIVVREYSQAKKWMPGYTYVPPVNWDVPQKYPGVCRKLPNVRKLTGLVDRGLPLNVLELNPEGDIADKEDDVSLTNVGSMLPKFNYQEEPFSKPYV